MDNNSELESLESTEEKPQILGPNTSETTDRTPLDIDHDLKFVGFQQPKESGFWVSVKHHKLRSILASLGVVVLIGAGTLVLVSSRNKTVEPLYDQAKSAEDDTTSEEVQPAADQNTDLVTDISKADYSLNTNGSFFELVSDDGASWLTRSEYSWHESAQWRNWLFFASKRGMSADGSTPNVGIEAFNFSSKTYLPLTQITPPSGTFLGEMYVMGEYLYIPFSEYKIPGATYRCRLDEQKSCSEITLFYDGSGSLTVFDDTAVVAYDLFADADYMSATLTRYNAQTKEKKELAKIESTLGVGANVSAIASDGLIWITETTGDIAQMQAGDASSYRVSRLYAIDIEGNTKFVLPADAIPLAGAKQEFATKIQSDKITYYTDTQQVVFDATTKQFGSVQKRSAAVTDSGTKTDIRKIVEISTKLSIPDDYVIRAVR